MWLHQFISANISFNSAQTCIFWFLCAFVTHMRMFVSPNIRKKYTLTLVFLLSVFFWNTYVSIHAHTSFIKLRTCVNTYQQCRFVVCVHQWKWRIHILYVHACVVKERHVHFQKMRRSSEVTFANSCAHVPKGALLYACVTMS
jgi:hypothetical protein